MVDTKIEACFYLIQSFKSSKHRAKQTETHLVRKQWIRRWLVSKSWFVHMNSNIFLFQTPKTVLREKKVKLELVL